MVIALEIKRLFGILAAYGLWRKLVICYVLASVTRRYFRSIIVVYLVNKRGRESLQERNGGMSGEQEAIAAAYRYTVASPSDRSKVGGNAESMVAGEEPQ